MANFVCIIQEAQIVSDLAESIARIVGHAPDEVDVVTVDIPSKWNMAGGELLPEPGEEDAWLARHAR